MRKMINEANSLGAEITNKTFRKYMEKFGLGGVHLLKGDGYLYFVTDEDCDPDIKDYIDELDSTSIYMNSFADQKPEDWARMIWDMTYGRREKEEEEAKERANAPRVFKIPRLKLQAPAAEIAEDANAHIHWVKTVVKNGTIYVKIRPSEFDSYLHDLNHWANVDYKKEDFEMTMLTNLEESVNEETFESFAKSRGYRFVNEANEPAYMRGELSAWDREKISKGQKPSWAKSITDIPPRPKKVAGSSSPSELAMRSVTDPHGKKEPYRESDWRRDKENAKELNKRVAERIEKQLDDYDHIDCDTSAEYFSIYRKAEDGQTDEFRIYPHGMEYMIKYVGHTSIFDRDSRRVGSVREIVDYINNMRKL